MRACGYSFQNFLFSFFSSRSSAFVGSPGTIVYVFQRLFLSWLALVAGRCICCSGAIRGLLTLGVSILRCGNSTWCRSGAPVTTRVLTSIPTLTKCQWLLFHSHQWMSGCSGDSCPWLNDQIWLLLSIFWLLERRGCKGRNCQR